MTNGLKVMKERCDQCLFSENRVVRKGRVAEILKECRKKEKYFVCHKASIKQGRGADTMCRGFYDTQDTQLIQIADRLNLVSFIDEKDLHAMKAKRGFASMDPQRMREIASMGGKAAHAQGTAHKYTPEEGRAAGKKGGLARTGRKDRKGDGPGEPKPE